MFSEKATKIDETSTVDLTLGAIHKLRLLEEGGMWSKKLTFCKRLYHRKCILRGVGGQKKPNLVNVVYERPPSLLAKEGFIKEHPCLK